MYNTGWYIVKFLRVIFFIFDMNIYFLSNFYWNIVDLQFVLVSLHSKVNQLYAYIYPLKSSGPYKASPRTKLAEVMEFQFSYFKS